jgi:hypothetical protein
MARGKKGLSKFTKEELLVELARRESDGMFREGMTLSEMERAVERFKHAAGGPTLQQMLRRLPPEKASAKACPKCGRRIPVKVKERERTVLTLSGPVVFKRNYHHCETCKYGFYPVDQILELPEEGELSMEMEKRVLDFALNDTFCEGAKRWSVHYPFAISDNMVRGVADRVGRLAEDNDPTYLQSELKPRSASPARVLYVQTDGGMLPLRGEEPWKEAKLGVLFRDDAHLPATEEKRRGQLTEARYVGSMGGQENFEAEIRAALSAEGAKRAGTVVWMGDGAAGNWTLAQCTAPGCVEILDWHHAVEHGMNLGKAILGESNPLLPVWKKGFEQLLFEGDNDALVRELMECLSFMPAEAIKVLDDEIRYYRTNAARMRYKKFREAGLLIGTGIVESGHRHVFQVRMKRAGQHWDPKRAARMVRMRAAYRTNPDGYYEAIRRAHWRTRTEPRKQRAQTRRRASNL